MAADPRKRQRKLERRTGKRKEKKHVVLREQSQGVRARIEAAAQFPVLHCSVSHSLWESGLGWVLLSRSMPDGSVAAAIFLVDPYCLGVKDAMAEVVSRFSYESDFLGKMQEMAAREMAPADARKLVESAVEYARGLGLAAHPDYTKAKPIFGDIDPAQSTEHFEFGHGGKPFFVAGPLDSPRRCREIIATLERTCGPGGYEFMIPTPEITGAELEDGDGEWDLEDDEEE